MSEYVDYWHCTMERSGMRYCKNGRCLCVEFHAKDIRVDANLCQCDHDLHQHNMTGSTDEGTDDLEVTISQLDQLPLEQALRVVRGLPQAQRDRLAVYGSTRLR